ncbi:hypothetical protein SAMN02910263_03681 [Butyrivibrio sp. INlla16]|nr:hypothetical protein SAMN02910263_03681 [Butyrivibrio sp. INlla16]
MDKYDRKTNADLTTCKAFYEMLETLAGDDPEEKAETKTWARSLGWTGRMSRPGNML